MQCPVCGFQNLTGAEVCDNCGADLAGADVPQPTLSFHGRLLGEHLDELGAPPPLTVSPETPVQAAISRMHDTEADCVLVTVDDRLVGIFTDRDAVVKVAGKPLDGLQIRIHDPGSGRPPPRRPDRDRDPQDGRRGVPPHPDHPGRPADRGRHCARRLPPPRGDDRLTARVAILADDLIWATRLDGLVRGAGAEPVAVRSLAALEAVLPDVDGVVDRPDGARLRWIEAARGRAVGRRARLRGRPARRCPRCEGGRLRRADRVCAVSAPDGDGADLSRVGQATSGNWSRPHDHDQTHHPRRALPDRIAAARDLARDAGFGAVLVGVGADMRYLAGYPAMPLERLTMLVVPAAGAGPSSCRGSRRRPPDPARRPPPACCRS